LPAFQTPFLLRVTCPVIIQSHTPLLPSLPPSPPPVLQVVKQDKPFLTLASVNPSSLSSFISRLPVGARRVGLLYGWLQEEGREGGKKEGHVAAVLEVEEEWQEHECVANEEGREGG